VSGPHGATLRKRTGVFVFQAFELNQGIQRKCRHGLPACGKPDDFDIWRQELAVFHRRKGFRMERKLRRTFAMGVEAYDRIADSEFG
jgi:hypothetical protein